MKIASALVLCLVICAGLALAGNDKPADTTDYVIENPGRITIVGELKPDDPTWERGYNLAYPPPTPTTCDYEFTDHSGGLIPYDAHCIQSTDDAPIEIVVSKADIDDTTLFLFCAGFDPLDPLANGVYWDDDHGPSLLSAFTLDDNVVLTPGTQYWLVISVYNDFFSYGSYHIDLSDNLKLYHVATEPNDWSSVKALYR